MLITEQVAQYLSTNVAFLTFSKTGSNSTIYINELPSDKSIVASIYTADADNRDEIDGYSFTKVKIIYRGSKNPIDSEEKAKTIFDTLQNLNAINFVVSQSYIVSCIAEGSLSFMGRDANDYPEYVMRFIINYTG